MADPDKGAARSIINLKYVRLPAMAVSTESIMDWDVVSTMVS